MIGPKRMMKKELASPSLCLALPRKNEVEKQNTNIGIMVDQTVGTYFDGSTMHPASRSFLVADESIVILLNNIQANEQSCYLLLESVVTSTQMYTEDPRVSRLKS